MSASSLSEHLQTGATHVCHCWSVTRRDGRVIGFTDHDRALTFEGITFSPEAGLSARALASSAGLSINNTAAIGVLSSDAITEADIAAGRYDGAEVAVWLVCWDDVAARQMRFRGQLGEITRHGGAFEAELLGLTEAINEPQGRSYLKTCSAVLGDARCQFQTNDPSYMVTIPLAAETDGQTFVLPKLPLFNARWFEHGMFEVVSGAAHGLRGAIKSDTIVDDARQIVLWSPIAAPLVVGDTVRLTAGCDKRAATCREKFANSLNYQGFPDIPGDDWLLSVPRSDQAKSGGSLSR
jgi:uncharacterized phage protein (TIGR02218 family)